MPIKDDEARRTYFRDYMRRRRAGEKPTPKAKATPSQDAEIAALRAENEELRKAKAAPLTDEERNKLDFQLRHTRNELRMAQDEIAKLKARIVKLKPPLDPESEAAKLHDQNKALRKKNKKLEDEKYEWIKKVKSLVPPAAKAKFVKAFTESSTTKANRLDALQTWNAMGLNNIGKGPIEEF